MKHNRNTAILIIACLLLVTACRQAAESSTASTAGRPKIVVGLMVDQMRWDYLYKYQERYGEDGFKRLLREGFSCENTLIRHAPTITACGHASVYTGSVPAINGIAGNSWYDRSLGREVANVEDTTVSLVGINSGEGRSPRNLLTTTIGDELRIATHYQSKVVGVSIKDRAAILPAGHTANGAFWYEGEQFISSTYYMQELPDWVNRFNAINWVDSLMPGGWNTLYPVDTYILSDKDDKDYEDSFDGEERPVFPHKKAPISSTPYGNALTLAFAKAAIEGYKLGESGFTDMLTISLSSPDKIGHRFGPNSVEVEDNYLRLDKDLGAFFRYLDQRFGKDGYLFFITADHGVDHSPGYLEENKLPSGLIGRDIVQHVKTALKKKFGIEGIISSMVNGQVYLNDQVLAGKGLDKNMVAQFIAMQLKQEPGIANAFPAEAIGSATLPEPARSMYINGYHPGRSGDILLLRSAGWKTGSRKGASHGDWYPYDAHIPLVWMGKGITPGRTHRITGMTDIAPTLAALLNIQMPSGNIGQVITEITD